MEPTSETLRTEQETPGFWSRVFGGKSTEKAGAGSAAEKATAEEGKQAAPPTRPRNAPRRRSKTIFDQAEVEQRRRHKKAALMRRDRLTQAIGERVERAIDERLEASEAKLAGAAGAFEDMNLLLGAIGRNLDEQGRRAERVAEVLEGLPEQAAEEQRVLGSIAERLERQATSVQGVPEVVDLVRHGSRVAEQRLGVLVDLKQELERQRSQREQVLATLREGARRFEERLSSLEEVIAAGQVAARSDARCLQRAIERHTDALREESREGAARAEALGARLREVGELLGAGNALARETAFAQGEALRGFQRAQEGLAGRLSEAQLRTAEELARLQEELRERQAGLLRSQQRTVFGAAAALAVVAAVCTLGLLFWGRPAAGEAAARPRASFPADAPALPAGMPRDRAR